MTQRFIDLIKTDARKKINKVKFKSTLKAESQDTFGAIMVVFYCKQTKKKNKTIYRTFISDSCETSIIQKKAYKIIGQKLSRTNTKMQ